MKKIFFFILLIFTSGIIFSCNKSSDSDSDTDYVDPGNWGGFTIPNKSYTISSTTSDSCGSSSDCCAIIFQGKLDDTHYVGIAVDNRDTDNPPTFKFKIYWKAKTIPTGSGLTLPSCTIIINDDSGSGINVTGATIANIGDGTYTINFSGPITFGSETLTSVDIQAYKY